MKRRIILLSLLVILSVAMLCLSSCIPDEIQFELNADGESYYVSNIRSGVKVAEIPSEHEGKPVTAIGERAGEHAHNSLRELVIPEGVTIIKDSAFRGCRALEKITLPSSLKTIEECAFDYTPDNTTKIHIADVDSYLAGEYLSQPKGEFYLNDELITTLEVSGEPKSFFGSKQITEVVIKSSVKEIPDRAFSCFYALKKVTFEKGLEKIGYSAFESCTSLEEISLPEGFKSIGNMAFYDCTGLKKITLPASLTEVSHSAFDNVGYDVYTQTGENLQIHISDVNAWCSVGFSGHPYFYDLYLNGTLVTELIISGVEEIGWSAFESCYSIKKITIGAGVKRIEHCAFYDCNALESVTIGKDVVSLQASAFDECEKLEKITFENSSAGWRFSDGRRDGKFSLGTPEKNAYYIKTGDLPNIRFQSPSFEIYRKD